MVSPHARLTADDIGALSNALVLLLMCAASDPALLEGDVKATIQSIRTFAQHAISIFFERFQTFVRDTNGTSDEENIDRAWGTMNRFIHGLRDEEFLPELVDGLETLIELDVHGIERLKWRWADNREWFKKRKRERDERRKVCFLVAHNPQLWMLTPRFTFEPGSRNLRCSTHCLKCITISNHCSQYT